jgi:hypothetical protein
MLAAVIKVITPDSCRSEGCVGPTLVVARWPGAAVRQPGDHKVASNRLCWRLDFTGDRH